MYQNLIFDLDGTLIDTLPDITHAVNQALQDCGYDYSYTVEEAKCLIGNGAETLMRRALRGKGNDEEAFQAFKPVYLRYYALYQCDTSKPYPGVVDFLLQAKAHGIGLYVVTNKPEALAHEILDAKIGKGVFKAIYGQRDGIPHKPDPTIPNMLIEKEKLDKKTILWIGDSLVDQQSADNVGVDCVLVSWGYGLNACTRAQSKFIYSLNELFQFR